MRELHAAIVTGPTGAIGYALCKRLVGEGIKVVAIVHPGSQRLKSLGELDRVQTMACDLAELATLPARLGNMAADAFFHLAWAGTTGAGRNDMSRQVDNIRYTLDACKAAKELGCSVFVGAGSQAEYGRHDEALTPHTPCFPESGYGMAKLCAGQMSRAVCKELGMDHIWPRILSVYGPHDGKGAMIPSVIRKLLAGEKPSMTPGTQIWDYLYADDAAEALLRMALFGKDGAIYPLGSGTARPLRQYVEAIRDAIDPALPVGFGEMAFAPGQVMRLEADISALSADTGFAPKVDFESGIRQTIEWIKEHGNE